MGLLMMGDCWGWAGAIVTPHPALNKLDKQVYTCKREIYLKTRLDSAVGCSDVLGR